MTASAAPIRRFATLCAGCLTPPPGRARRLWAIGYGILTHLAFVAGVGAMMIAMFFGLSGTFGTVAWPWSVAANAALILQFPIAHSFLLNASGRRLLQAVLPRGHGKALATTTYALIASLQLLALFVFWTPSGIVWWQAEGGVLVLLCLAYGGSWLLLLKAILDAGIELQIGALGWMSLLQDIPVQFPDMPQNGLFSVIRQPIYVAFALTLWTVPVWTPDQLALAVCFTTYCLFAPLRKEERFLGIYGERFRAYKTRVPYMLPLRTRRDAKTQE